MSDRLNAVYSLIEKLKNDYHHNDEEVFRIHPSITFDSSTKGGGGTGEGICIRANKPIQRKEILMIVPNSARMATNNLAKKSRSNLTTLMQRVEDRLVEILPKTSDIQDYLLAFGIMYASSNPNNNNSKSIFKKHMAYMPSHYELRNDLQMCLYWTKEQLEVLGGPKSCVRRQIELRQETVKLAFDEAIYPELKTLSFNIQKHFIMSSVSKCCHDFKSTEECLWESYLASFTLGDSRSHNGMGAPGIIPLIDLFNGVSDWSPDTNDHVRCNVAIEISWQFNQCSVIYAQRDIDVGEELLISYGNSSPSLFLVGYGIIPPYLFDLKKPEVTGLLCPPDIIPTDERRILVLEMENIPVEGISNKDIGILDADSYFENEKGNETENILYLCNLLWILSIATDEEMDFYIKTGRRKPPGLLYSSNQSMCHALCKVIDYNMTLLQDDSSTDGVLLLSSSEEECERMNRNDIPLWEKYALRSRICQRETLSMWRSHFCRQIQK